jgi:hypothetical protein
MSVREMMIKRNEQCILKYCACLKTSDAGDSAVRTLLDFDYISTNIKPEVFHYKSAKD